MRSALSLFCSWLFSSWQVTTTPVGTCVIRTAESVVLTDCPPGPLERYTSISRSFGSMATSSSSASGSTATVAALVWTRPWLSVTGTRCTRWGPASCLSRAHASGPLTTRVTSRTPPMSEGWVESVSTFQPWRRANASYMRASSAAHRLASSPPSAPRISRMTLRPSLGSVGTSSSRSRASRACAGAAPFRRSRPAGTRASRRRPRPPGAPARRRGRPRCPVVAVRVDDRAQLGVASSRVARGAPGRRRRRSPGARDSSFSSSVSRSARRSNTMRQGTDDPVSGQLSAGTGSKRGPRTGSVSCTPSQSSPVAYSVRKSDGRHEVVGRVELR